MTEWLLILIACLVAALLVIVSEALRSLRSSAAQLGVLARSVSAAARVTSTTTTAPGQVHLVLMDRDEQKVDFVLKVDPQHRAQTVTHGASRYECVSGSVDEGYFIYRRG